MHLGSKNLAIACAVISSPTSAFQPCHSFNAIHPIKQTPRAKAIPTLRSAPSLKQQIFEKNKRQQTALEGMNFDWLTPEIAAYGKLGLDLIFGFTVSTKVLELSDKIKARSENEAVKLGIDLAAAFLIVQCLNLCSSDIQKIQTFNEPLKQMTTGADTEQLQQVIGQLTELMNARKPLN